MEKSLSDFREQWMGVKVGEKTGLESVGEGGRPGSTASKLR